MRILVVADIHANWPALQAVAAEPYDVCLCVGDLVDYALEPAPCIAWVRDRVQHAVRGNHDHGVAQNVVVHGRSGFKYLTGATRPLTRERLGDSELRFLSRLPVTRLVTLDNTRYLLVHATPRDPLDEYALPDVDFWARRLENVEADVICVGHTHQPYVLEVGDKLVINPGSVGQPRDGDPRASVAIIEDYKVDLKRIEYPIEDTIAAIVASSLADDAKDMLAEVLRTGASRRTARKTAERTDWPRQSFLRICPVSSPLSLYSGKGLTRQTPIETGPGREARQTSKGTGAGNGLIASRWGTAVNQTLIERLQGEMRKALGDAASLHDSGNVEEMRAAIETAMARFEWIQHEGYRPPAEELSHLQGILLSLGYSEEGAADLVLAKKKQKKLDIKGKSSGGSEHKRKKRPSTKGKHQKGHATKRKSYGGEKADDGRRYPRNKPDDWKGPWPPPEEPKAPQPTGGDTEEPFHGSGEDLEHEGEGEMTGQELYEKAVRLAREADKNGGPLPVALLQKAVSAGYPPAMHALANWHLHGKGVKKDYKKAFSLLRKAAKQRFAAAEYDLAVSYERGKGVAKSEKKAWLYYLQAANDGDRDAMTEAARCFYHGIGTKKDFAKAAEWYRKAAVHGDSDAQYALGVAYEHGEGVEKNIHTAMQWYKKAAEQGDKEAEKALVELEDREE